MSKYLAPSPVPRVPSDLIYYEPLPPSASHIEPLSGYQVAWMIWIATALTTSFICVGVSLFIVFTG